MGPTGMCIRLWSELNPFPTRRNCWCWIPKRTFIIASVTSWWARRKATSPLSKRRPPHGPPMNRRTMTTTTRWNFAPKDLGYVLIRGHWISFYYLFISFWVIDTPTTANDYTRNRILHVCDLFTLGFLTVHIICMANQLFRRVLRSFTCAGFFRQTFRVLSWIPGTIWVFCFFFLLELEILIRWGARSFAMQMCFQWGEKAEIERNLDDTSLFSNIFPLYFNLKKKLFAEKKKLSVKPCKADWGRIIENPSLRPFPGFKRPVCLFFFNQICGLEFWFDLRGEFWYRQGLDRDWILGTGFCSYFFTSLLRIKRMKWKPRNSQLDEPNWNQHRCVHGVPTHNSESVGKILESVYVEKRGK